MSLVIKELKDLIKKGKITNFSFDSRDIEEKGLFFALKGEKTDGHNFLKMIFQKKAFGAVVKKNYKGPTFNLKLFRVKNVENTLQTLAKEILEERRKKVIGITGSLGKTTTKEFIFTLIQGKYEKVSKTPGNYNSQAGLPLSILNMEKEKEKEVFVLEMGMCKKKEMEKLSKIAKADIALITNISFSHSENFKNLLEIASEKSKIFCKSTKIKIINYSLLKYKKLFNKKDFCTFSTKNRKADFFLESENDKIVIYENNKKIVFDKFLEETHFLENFLAAYVVSRKMGLKVLDIKKRLKYLKTPKMRFEKIQKKGVLFILDCYNASKDSMIAAFKNLPKAKGKKIAILGEMRELGKFSKKLHERVGKEANEEFDLLLCIGENCKHVMDNFFEKKFLFKDHKSLAKYLKRVVRKGDLVLIKGSRALEMEKVLNFL
jgi:UDP-N-acetylmuramoyl-tripeptide--D-alanyl-D-alanine ligase